MSKYTTFTGIHALPEPPEPPPCPECRGKCCRDDYGYRIEHMGAESYEHRCESCDDGMEPAPMLHLYLLRQAERRGYDTYDSCVVAARSEAVAKCIHPDGYTDPFPASNSWKGTRTWADPEHVEATYLGVADGSVKPGVVCASFNAG